MEDEELEDEDFTIEKAKAYRKKGETKKAELILEKLWDK